MGTLGEIWYLVQVEEWKLNIDDTVKSFLNTLNEGPYYDSSKVTYERKVNVFIEFLTYKLKINDQNFVLVMSGLDDIYILDSVKYYVETYNIRFKTTVDHFLIVIRRLFIYLNKELNIKNETFDSQKKFNNLKESLDELSKEMKLDQKKQKYPISDTNFCKLAYHCNEQIKTYDVSLIDVEALTYDSAWSTPYKEYTSALITKLVMLTGVKNNVISTLKAEDFNPKESTLVMNGYIVELPDKLNYELNEYMSLRSKFKTPHTELFLTNYGEPCGSKYQDMFCCVNDILNNHVVESVAKYTIVELIRLDTNIHILKEFTGFGFDTIQHCLELANEMLNIEEKNSHIRNKLCSMQQRKLL